MESGQRDRKFAAMIIDSNHEKKFWLDNLMSFPPNRQSEKKVLDRTMGFKRQLFHAKFLENYQVLLYILFYAYIHAIDNLKY